jgi:8-oxo-dGTP diphosphatase
MPYDEMWADDRLWLPHLLAGKRFRGRFVFASDYMIEHEVLTDEETTLAFEPDQG